MLFIATQNVKCAVQCYSTFGETRGGACKTHLLSFAPLVNTMHHKFLPLLKHTHKHTCTLNSAILFVKVTRFCQKQSLAEVKRREREPGSFNFCLSAIRLPTVWSSVICFFSQVGQWDYAKDIQPDLKSFSFCTFEIWVCQLLIKISTSPTGNLLCTCTTLQLRPVVWKMLIAYANWIQI